jgi:hypothetical protein
MRTLEINRQTSILSRELAQVLVAGTEIEDFAYMRDFLDRTYRDRALIRSLRGHKSRTLAALFDEWSAALQFPIYFGENWAALTDCLRDLPRAHPADHLLLIANAADLLRDDPQSLPTLFTILQSIPADWEALSPHTPGLTLKVVLQEGQARRDTLQAELAALAISYDLIHGDWLGLLK